MNKFEEMNVTEQMELCGGIGYPTGPIIPTWFIEKIVPVVAGAVAGAVSVLSGMK